LVNGHSQGQFLWGSKPGVPEPKVRLTGLFGGVQGTPFATA
jgi:hypothetical protein